jgi:hypothetical protein
MRFSNKRTLNIKDLGRSQCSIGVEIWIDIEIRLEPAAGESDRLFEIVARIVLNAPGASTMIPIHEAELVIREAKTALRELENQMRIRVVEFPCLTPEGKWPHESLIALESLIGPSRYRNYDPI